MLCIYSDSLLLIEIVSPFTFNIIFNIVCIGVCYFSIYFLLRSFLGFVSVFLLFCLYENHLKIFLEFYFNYLSSLPNPALSVLSVHRDQEMPEYRRYYVNTGRIILNLYLFI